MKKIILIMIITILITGCTNDINNEIIVTSLYIDNNLTCIYIVPNEKDSYVDTISSQGDNYKDMYDNLNNQASQKLYFDHLTTIIINENIKYDDLINFLNIINIKDNVNIVLAKNIPDIINKYKQLAPFTTPSTTLKSKKIKTITYKELKQNKNIYLPIITYKQDVIFVGYKKMQS